MSSSHSAHADSEPLDFAGLSYLSFPFMGWVGVEGGSGGSLFSCFSAPRSLQNNASTDKKQKKTASDTISLEGSSDCGIQAGRDLRRILSAPGFVESHKNSRFSPITRAVFTVFKRDIAVIVLMRLAVFFFCDQLRSFVNGKFDDSLKIGTDATLGGSRSNLLTWASLFVLFLVIKCLGAAHRRYLGERIRGKIEVALTYLFYWDSTEGWREELGGGGNGGEGEETEGGKGEKKENLLVSTVIGDNLQDMSRWMLPLTEMMVIPVTIPYGIWSVATEMKSEGGLAGLLQLKYAIFFVFPAFELMWLGLDFVLLALKNSYYTARNRFVAASMCYLSTPKAVNLFLNWRKVYFLREVWPLNQALEGGRLSYQLLYHWFQACDVPFELLMKFAVYYGAAYSASGDSSGRGFLSGGIVGLAGYLDSLTEELKSFEEIVYYFVKFRPGWTRVVGYWEKVRGMKDRIQGPKVRTVSGSQIADDVRPPTQATSTAILPIKSLKPAGANDLRIPGTAVFSYTPFNQTKNGPESGAATLRFRSNRDDGLTIKRGDMCLLEAGSSGGKSMSCLSFLKEELFSKNLPNASTGSSGPSFAYVPSRPFLLERSIRDNVTFGLPYDGRIYNISVMLANLPEVRDKQIRGYQVGEGSLLMQLEELSSENRQDGDNTANNDDSGEEAVEEKPFIPCNGSTLTGDTVLVSRGENISGGQRQRVCLSRAVYATLWNHVQFEGERGAEKSDRFTLLILDNSLSALDKQTASGVVSGLFSYLKKHNIRYASWVTASAVEDSANTGEDENQVESSFGHILSLLRDQATRAFSIEEQQGKRFDVVERGSEWLDRKTGRTYQQRSTSPGRWDGMTPRNRRSTMRSASPRTGSPEARKSAGKSLIVRGKPLKTLCSRLPPPPLPNQVAGYISRRKNSSPITPTTATTRGELRKARQQKQKVKVSPSALASDQILNSDFAEDYGLDPSLDPLQQQAVLDDDDEKATWRAYRTLAGYIGAPFFIAFGVSVVVQAILLYLSHNWIRHWTLGSNGVYQENWIFTVLGWNPALTGDALELANQGLSPGDQGYLQDSFNRESFFKTAGFLVLGYFMVSSVVFCLRDFANRRAINTLNWNFLSGIFLEKGAVGKKDKDFFDVTPVGELETRVSQDCASVAPEALYDRGPLRFLSTIIGNIFLPLFLENILKAIRVLFGVKPAAQRIPGYVESAQDDPTTTDEESPLVALASSLGIVVAGSVFLYVCYRGFAVKFRRFIRRNVRERTGRRADVYQDFSYAVDGGLLLRAYGVSVEPSTGDLGQDNNDSDSNADEEENDSWLTLLALQNLTNYQACLFLRASARCWLALRISLSINFIVMVKQVLISVPMILLTGRMLEGGDILMVAVNSLERSLMKEEVFDGYDEDAVIFSRMLEWAAVAADKDSEAEREKEEQIALEDAAKTAKRAGEEPTFIVDKSAQPLKNPQELEVKDICVSYGYAGGQKDGKRSDQQKNGDVDASESTPQENFVLRNFNLSLPRGDRLLIVGRSGVGKSTLLNALVRQIELATGRIVYNPVDARERINLDAKSGGQRELLIARGARSTPLPDREVMLPDDYIRMGLFRVLPQTPFCFHGSIFYNLDLEGKLNKKTVLYPIAMDLFGTWARGFVEPEVQIQAVNGGTKTESNEKEGKEGAALLRKVKKDPVLEQKYLDFFDGKTVNGKDASDVTTCLSLAQKLCLHVARVLAQSELQRPQVLLVDEVTSQLSDKDANAMMRLILDRFRDQTILCVSHQEGLEAFSEFGRKLRLLGAGNVEIEHLK